MLASPRRKIGARFVRHARAITFQLAEVAVADAVVRTIFAVTQLLRVPSPLFAITIWAETCRESGWIGAPTVLKNRKRRLRPIDATFARCGDGMYAPHAVIAPLGFRLREGSGGLADVFAIRQSMR